MSSSTSTGLAAYMFSRSLYLDIETRQTWNSWVALSPLSVRELQFWVSVDFHRLTSPIVLPPFRPGIFLWSDAGAEYWGAHILQPYIMAQGTFHGLERYTFAEEFSSTARELFAILGALKAFKTLLRGHEVLIHTDNQAVAFILAKGGSIKPDLHYLAMDLFLLAFELGVRFKVVWVPRDTNQLADWLSKHPDLDAWGIAPWAFHAMARHYSYAGSLDVDLFASEYNHKLPVFGSRLPTLSCTFVDAFTVPWQGFSLPYICGPWALLGRIMRKLRVETARAVVVLPVWPRRPWWTHVAPDGAHWAPYILDVYTFPEGDTLFISDPDAPSAPPRNKRTVAVLVDFRPTAQWCFTKRCIWGSKCRVCKS